MRALMDKMEKEMGMEKNHKELPEMEEMEEM